MSFKLPIKLIKILPLAPQLDKKETDFSLTKVDILRTC